MPFTQQMVFNKHLLFVYILYALGKKKQDYFLNLTLLNYFKSLTDLSASFFGGPTPPSHGKHRLNVNLIPQRP